MKKHKQIAYSFWDKMNYGLSNRLVLQVEDGPIRTIKCKLRNKLHFCLWKNLAAEAYSWLRAL
jgi:hypothetical protein